MRFQNTPFRHVFAGSLLVPIVCALLLARTPRVAAASSYETVAVVFGPESPELDQFAANELCGYLEKLFGLIVKPTTTIPSNATSIFIIGNPTTNPLVAKESFPAVSEQGIVLRSVGSKQTSRMIVGGGSPTATMWAVYDLVERWGVRYLLHSDVLPARLKFEMPFYDLVQEPTLRVRQWRVVNEHAIGPVSWGIADYRPLLDQLAKMKFNRIFVNIWPEHPFLPFEYKGLRHTGGTLYFGGHFPITDDMVGRSLFGTEREFWNPDLPLPGGDPVRLNQAAIKHIRNLLDYGHSRGMQSVMSVTVTEFPIVFEPLIKHTRMGHMTGKYLDDLGGHTFGIGAGEDMDNPDLVGLARAVIQATLETYPGVDYLALQIAEHRDWARQYEQAWNSLDARHGISQACSLNSVLAAANARKNYPGGSERAVNEVKADILTLYFFDRIIADTHVTRILDSAKTRFVVDSIAEELFPVLGRIFPSGCETLNFIDYTPARIVQRRAVLRNIPAHDVPSVLIHTLHDDNIGVLPQLSTHSLHVLTKDIRILGWAGFSMRYWLIGDHDPCMAYLAHAAWDEKVTPEDIYRDQISRICGAQVVPDMMRVFSEVEAATVTLEWHGLGLTEPHGLGLTFTTPNMITRQWVPQPISAELKSVTMAYQTALDAAQRALRRTEPTGQEYINYWIGRLKFGISYMRTIEAVRAAATADAAMDTNGAIRETVRALDLVTNGLTSYANVARDRSDKAAIAVMNEYVVRALQRKIEVLEKNSGLPQPSSKRN